MHDFAGRRLGHYEILSRTGAGAMGEVYRARDLRLGRIVALKTLAAALCEDRSRLECLRREARILASLDHPNIATIHSLEEPEGRAPFLVLEFVEGETLAARLARGPLQLTEAITAGIAIASALHAAHANGVIHRDLKPGNVMLTASGSVKVLDFGLACRREVPSGSIQSTLDAIDTHGGAILGTLGYMSPEQARGRPVDRRTDVWSFGCVLFECLSGVRAFQGDTVSDLIAHTLEHEPPWSELPSVPPRLADLLRRCLRKDPAERGDDLGALAEELQAIGADPGGAAGPSRSSPFPSVVVLDFENLSSEPDLEYFCAGVREDILTDLSKLQGLRVASRSVVARFRGSTQEIPRLAAELNVGAVLQGSVRRSGNRIRITAQLVSAADAFHLWAERYDRTLDDVFAVQEEIATSIASALRGALTTVESAALRRDRPEDVRAYDLYLKGRHLYRRYTADSLRQALRLFEQAVALDPKYALAWAGIADCHGQMLQFEIAADREEAVRRGLTAARRSVALDPTIAEGHKSEALILLYIDKEASKAALRLALEANPRHAPAMINLAGLLIGSADIAGAERLIRGAVEVDPHEELNLEWLSKLTFWTGRPDEALALTDLRLRLASEPRTVVDIQVLRASIHLRRGDDAAAAGEIWGGAKEVGPGAEAGPEAELQAAVAAIAARAGRIAEARRALRTFEGASGSNDQALLLGAEAALLCGETEAAARLMGRPVITWGVSLLLRLDPGLHPLLERKEFGPPRSEFTLIWPAEAPPVDDSIRGLFSGFSVESGRP